MFDILNKTAIRDKMQDPPKGQRLHHAFDGDWSLLTIEQIEDIKNILLYQYAEDIAEIDRVLCKFGL